MPYLTPTGRFERGSALAHSNIIKNVVVREALRTYESCRPDEATHVIDEKYLVMNREPARSPRRYIFSFDGSSQEVADDDMYPSQKICYIQIAGVFTDLELLHEQKHKEFVDPQKVQESIGISALPFALPSCFKVKRGFKSVLDSWRAEIFRYFNEYEVEGTTLLQTYWKLSRLSDRYNSNQDALVLKGCPAKDCDYHERIEVPMEGTECPKCHNPVYPTDALRIYEEVNEAIDNTGAANRLMTCLEHLTMISYVDYLRDRRMGALSRAAFIMDGPLAIMGPPAWLHNAIHSYIEGLNTELERAGYSPLVVLGIEKSGAFVDHANAIRNKLRRGQLMLLPDTYIYKFILPSKEREDSYYGQETYYGQKFFYMTQGEQLLTVTVAPRKKGAVNRESTEHYKKMLQDTLTLLDEVGTAFRRDAVIPVELAHNAASIPLKTGTRILRLLRESVAEESRLEPAHDQEGEG